MDEAVVEAIISFKAANLAAVEEAKVALGGLGTSVSGVNVHLKNHEAAAQGVSKGLKGVAEDAPVAARALSSVSAESANVISRFTTLGSMMGAGGGLGMAAGAGLVGVGAIVEFGKAAVENAEAQERADRLLSQAAAAAGRNIADLRRESESFISSHRGFISNQYEATEALAMFTRAGNDSKTTTEAMTAALDLSNLKNISLKDSARMVELAMMGNGRAVRELGIDLKTLSASTDVSETDTKRLEQAQKTAASAGEHLAKAQRSLQEEEDALHGKRNITQTDLDHLKDKQNEVAKAQAELNTANANVKRTQDELNVSQVRSKEVLEELLGKVKDGDASVTQLEQSHRRLTQSWQDLSERAGPRLVDALSAIVDGTDHAFDAGIRFDDFLTKHGANADQVAGKVISWQQQEGQAIVGTIGRLGDLAGALRHATSVAHIPITIDDSDLIRLRGELQSIFNQQYVLHFQSEHSDISNEAGMGAGQYP